MPYEKRMLPQSFEHWWLHQFLSTFAMHCLWAGLDLRTVQHWIGHSDMESKVPLFDAITQPADSPEDEGDFRLNNKCSAPALTGDYAF